MESPHSEMVKLDHDEFCIHSWNASGDGEALILIFHGMGSHGLYPTVRYAAEVFASDTDRKYKVLAPDMRGHGKSPGLQGYLPSADVVVEDACKVANYAIAKYTPKKLLLSGSSMGGTIALEVAQKLAENEKSDSNHKVAGIILLAPMLKLSVSSIEQSLLAGLSTMLSTWRLIPSSSTNAEKQYRDSKKREECENDAYTSKGSAIRVGTAHTCVSLANRVSFTSVRVPFWVGVADEDVVVNSEGSLELFEKAPVTDKTMKRYPALHGLMCEPSPLFEEIAKDIMDWVNERS